MLGHPSTTEESLPQQRENIAALFPDGVHKAANADETLCAFKRASTPRDLLEKAYHTEHPFRQIVREGNFRLLDEKKHFVLVLAEAIMKVGRLGETVFPLEWSDPTHRTLGHLVPDIVIHRGQSVQVVDAKYKSHLVEIDEADWRRMETEVRDAHRADLHQILAYASLYGAEEVTATLVYPLRYSTYASLHEQHRDRSFAELEHGGRTVHLELRGLPFGSIREMNA